MDTGGIWEKRARTLEDEFFFRVDKQLAAELKARMAAEEQKQLLARASGIQDDELLEKLMAAKITNESVVALALVPLVEVAWADGRIEKAERTAILEAAKIHCAQGSVGYALLESWLDNAPAKSLFDAWSEYTRLLCAKLSDENRRQLREQIVGRTREVATAAGGILGIHTISSKEEAVLQRVEQVFE